jgi:hypothetical protein
VCHGVPPMGAPIAFPNSNDYNNYRAAFLCKSKGKRVDCRCHVDLV